MINRKRWRRWIKAIDDTIFEPLRIFTPVFNGYIEILENNERIREPFHFHEWIIYNHSNSLLLTLRKIADKNKKSYSVRRLLGNIMENNKSLTKKSYLYGREKEFIENYETIWNSICGDSDFINKDIVQQDINKIKKLTAKDTNAVDKMIVHIDKNRRTHVFGKFYDVYSDLQSLLKIFHNYSELLRVTVDDSLEVTIRYDWEDIFKVPWIS